MTMIKDLESPSRSLSHQKEIIALTTEPACSLLFDSVTKTFFTSDRSGSDYILGPR